MPDIPDMRCPGQDTRYWRAEDICEVACPDCGRGVEFFPDDILRRCPGCGRALSNPKFNMGCLEWCRYAEKCLEGMMSARREALGPLRETVEEKVREVFGGDRRRILHAREVCRLAEEIGREEEADPSVLIPAALLHDVGLAGLPPDADTPEAREHGPRGAERAREILGALEFPEPLTRQVVALIHDHHDRTAMAETRNGAVLFDADLLVNLRPLSREDPAAAERRLAETALTGTIRNKGAEYLSRALREENEGSR